MFFISFRVWLRFNFEKNLRKLCTFLLLRLYLYLRKLTRIYGIFNIWQGQIGSDAKKGVNKKVIFCPGVQGMLITTLVHVLGWFFQHLCASSVKKKLLFWWSIDEKVTLFFACGTNLFLLEIDGSTLQLATLPDETWDSSTVAYI